MEGKEKGEKEKRKERSVVSRKQIWGRREQSNKKSVLRSLQYI